MTDPSDQARPIAVLLVTSNDGFAAAFERRLSPTPAADVSVASTLEGAIERLAAGPRIDCIVYDASDADENTPLRSDADENTSLLTIRAQAPTKPLVLVTTEANEPIATGTLPAGVTEMLRRDRHEDFWERLAVLVRDVVPSDRIRTGSADATARRKRFLRAASDPIVVVRDGVLEFVNDPGLSLLGVERRDRVVGTPVEAFFRSRTERTITDYFGTIQRGETAFDRPELRCLCVDGTTRPVEGTATRIEWAGAPAVAFVVRDIGETGGRTHELVFHDRLIDEAPIGVTIADLERPDNPLIYVNEAFQRLTGYTAEEVIGRNCRFLQGEETDSEAVAAMRNAIDAGESTTVELRNYRKDGTPFWNRVTISPITTSGGDVTRYVGFQEDVTDRKESERRLHRFKRAVEAAGYVIFMTDPDGTITYVNPAFERVTGYTSEEAIGNTPRILKSGEMSAVYYETLWETISGGDVWNEEIRNRRKSGEIYYADQTIAPLIQDGEIEAYVAIQTDVTERKERESQLYQYKRAVEGMEEPIAAVDGEYNYLFANRAYREFHGLDADAIEETTLLEGIGHETFETVKPYVERAFDGETVQYQMTRTRSQRPDRTFDVRYYPLTDADGVWGVVATLRDFTHRLEREEQLESMHRLLRHNVRNELNVIQGNTELIAERASPEVTELTTAIEAAAQRLVDQADKMREIVDVLSKPTTQVVLWLDETIERVVREAESEYPGVDFVTDLPSGVRITTIPHVERAVSEVIDNAAKHTDSGRPEVTVTLEEDRESVVIRVSDTGPGVPKRERDVISGAAEIKPLSHSRGMGLWLVKRILTRAGGTLRFDDADPQGSIVSLVLPRHGE